MTEKDKIYLYALSKIKGLSNRNLNRLLDRNLSPEKLFRNFPLNEITSNKKKNEIENQLKSNKKIEDAKDIINLSNEEDISILGQNDGNYPTLLKECIDAPALLFTKGNFNLNEKPLLSVVGTRSITNYGKSFCKELTTKLRDYNIGIVSGLAYGIDFEIHKNSLDSNLVNIGVLGSGIKNIYPTEHTKISQRIIENGLLISENEPHTPPISYNFPKRNRIIAGMSNTTIIVESPSKGGAMITAKLANDYNRDVYAVPGNIKQHFSKGCNELIKNNQAILLNDPEELIELLGLIKNKEKPKAVKIEKITDFKSDDEKRLYQLISKEKEISIDKIQQLTQLNFLELNTLLFNLELNDHIKQYPGKIFTL